MNQIKLNSILNLSQDEITNSKIYLCLENKESHERFLDIWVKSNPDNPEVGFAYWCGSDKKMNIKVDQLVFSFARIYGDRYLFITAGKVLKVAPNTSAEVEILEKYKPFFGRLVIEVDKNTPYGYCFNLNTYINEAEVIEVLSKKYNPISFKGLDSVHLKFDELLEIVQSEKHGDYKKVLEGIKGVYCLTDVKTGKLYIGSAYGDHGVAQRWKVYLDSKNGGNKDLVELYSKEGEKYFIENFEFTLLEYFSKNTDVHRIIERESYWKRALSSRKHGYNSN